MLSVGAIRFEDRLGKGGTGGGGGCIALTDSAWRHLQLPVERPWSMTGGSFVRRWLLLHNIVQTHLFILHINQPAYFMERCNIFISHELLNTQTLDKYQHVAKSL